MTQGITVSFLYGVNNYTEVTVLVTSTGGGFGATNYLVDTAVVNGQTTPVTLNI